MSLDADYDLSNSDDIYALRLAIAQAYGVPIGYIQLGSSSSRRRLSMHSVSPVRAAAATPERYLKNAHHLLILHGRYTCRARAPLCSQCVISSLCQWSSKTA